MDNYGKTKKRLPPFIVKRRASRFYRSAQKDKDNCRVNLGKITDVAAERIKTATGFDAKRIILDSDSVRHAFGKKEHNLLPNDLDGIVDIINTATNISLSPIKNKQGNSVIVFEKNGLSILEEYRRGKKELELQTAYRQAKVQQPHDAG